jgi:NSS family neurotransmitter:Na+ symporter
MGQAFFSLSLGMGCLCTYASYFDRETNIAKTALQVCAIDTFIALMAGFIIFPAAFSAGYSIGPNDVGPSLIFITLPNVFQEAFAGLPILSYVFSVMFYLLLVVAALTSTISMHEVATAYLSEEFSMSRQKAATIITVSCTIIGVFCSLSFGVLADWKILGMNIFDFFDFTSSNILLPVGGMFISLFAGWYLDRKLYRDELTNGGKIKAPYFKILIFILKYVAPVAIGLILLNQIGVFSMFG